MGEFGFNYGLLDGQGSFIPAGSVGSATAGLLGPAGEALGRKFIAKTSKCARSRSGVIHF